MPRLRYQLTKLGESLRPVAGAIAGRMLAHLFAPTQRAAMRAAIAHVRAAPHALEPEADG